MTGGVRAANLAVKLLLELAAIAAYAVYGWHVGDGVTGVVLAALLPVAMVVVWGMFCAPRAVWRLPTRWRAPLELGILLLAAAALAAADRPVAGPVLGLVVTLNAVGLTVLRQWES